MQGSRRFKVVEQIAGLFERADGARQDAGSRHGFPCRRQGMLFPIFGQRHGPVTIAETFAVGTQPVGQHGDARQQPACLTLALGKGRVFEMLRQS